MKFDDAVEYAKLVIKKHSKFTNDFVAVSKNYEQNEARHVVDNNLIEALKRSKQEFAIYDVLVSRSALALANSAAGSLDAALQSWISQVLLSEAKRPKEKPGPKDALPQKVVTFLIVRELIQKEGFDPTRNTQPSPYKHKDEVREEKACDVVAEAYRQLQADQQFEDGPNTYEAVSHQWKEICRYADTSSST